MVNIGQCSQDCRVLYIEYTSKRISFVSGKRALSVHFQVSAMFAIMSEPASPSFRDESPFDDVPGGLNVGSNVVDLNTYMFNQNKYQVNG
jgi:hypothetical protein